VKINYDANQKTIEELTVDLAEAKVALENLNVWRSRSFVVATSSLTALTIT
jgi:hypothetical protein